ncbi:membrane protein of unknown function [Hyphomicrobium sp. 1Nfss2.1]|uniref:hypothetical protein n=1 Tax=Hyphomicrobium sp. 1Nfss2.1 TaxID=3413936 RepID=UPI003C7DE582
MSTAKKPSSRGARFGLALGIAICFIWSQVCGWAVTGRMLADDGARRGVQATSSSTAAIDLQRLQDERAAIGTPRTKGKVEADLDLELRKTSAKYPNGDGPNAVRLKGELEAIKRAEKLDTELIPRALKALESKPATAAGEVDVAVPVGIAKRMGWIGEDADAVAAAEQAAHFWFIVFIVFACAFFATFGFKFVGVTHEEVFERKHLLFIDKPIACVPLVFLLVEAGMNATYGWHRAGGWSFEALLQALMFAGAAVIGAYLPTRWGHVDKPHPARDPLEDKWAMHWGDRQIGHAGSAHAVAEHRASLAGRSLDELRAHNAERSDELARQHEQFRAGSDRPMAGASSEGAAGSGRAYPASPSGPQQSAPITINVGSPAAPAAEVKGQAPMLPSPDRRAGDSGSAPGATLLAPPAALETGAPVDRSGYQRKADHLLLFKAKEVEAYPGGLVSGGDMYARYVAWATARVIPERVFLELFPEIADLETDVIGGELHFVDVKIRGTYPRLVEAAG